MGDVIEKWSEQSPQTILYFGAITGVLLGFLNLLINQGIILSGDTGFYTLSSLSLIIWGILFFTLSKGKPQTQEEHKKRTFWRKKITLGMFIIIIIERLLPYSKENLFVAIILTLLAWGIYRLLTRTTLDIEEIVIQEAKSRKEGEETEIKTPLGISSLTILHYLLGGTAIILSIYLSLNTNILGDLQDSTVDIVMGLILSGLILLLMGFAISKGSKVIRFFDILIWVILTIQTLYTGFVGASTGYGYLLLIPTITILDYLLFNETSRIYFERMS